MPEHARVAIAGSGRPAIQLEGVGAEVGEPDLGDDLSGEVNRAAN